MNKLEKIELTQHLSKVKQLTDIITTAISTGRYKQGESLPSINMISSEYNISRDTVFKTFQELKHRGIVDSAPTKGYFVNNAEIKVLLLLNSYTPFKTELYNSIANNVGVNCKIDLHIFDNNEEKFHKIINESVDRYSYYLVMNSCNDIYCNIIDKLPISKVMLLDYGKFEKHKFSYACQGFDQTLYECMLSGLELFKKYKNISMVIPGHSEHPRSSIPYFQKFCSDYNFTSAVIDNFNPNEIKKGNAYLVVDHNHLIALIKECRNMKLELGKDVGVVVYNDEPIFEILDCGITVISTDFKKMGEFAAKFITQREPIQTYVETKLIIRGSL